MSQPGTGNLAIPAARARARSLPGLDIAPNLLVQARERAAAEGLTVTFDEGDAEALPYADASFDIVVTMFGAMFAPRPEMVASELGARVEAGRPPRHGQLEPRQLFRKDVQGRQHPCASASGRSAARALGETEATVRARLAPFFRNIETEMIPIDFDMPTNAAGAVAFFRKYFGPTQMAFNRLDEAGQAAFAADLEALWSGANVATNPDEHTMVRNEYLQVTATRPLRVLALLYYVLLPAPCSLPHRWAFIVIFWVSAVTGVPVDVAETVKV